MQYLPTLRRRDPGFSVWRDLDLLEDQMNRMMRTLPLWEGATEGLTWVPRVDLEEKDGEFILTTELPGVEPKDVDIQVEGNVLSIRGEKELERERTDEHVHVSERQYGSFLRAFTLPSAASPAQPTGGAGGVAQQSGGGGGSAQQTGRS